MNPKKVIKHFGGVSKAARALGCSPSTVSEWQEVMDVPEGRQYQIELATGGALRADRPALRTGQQQ